MTWPGMLLVAVAASASASVGLEPRPITLEEAVALAQRNAPAVIQAQGQKRTSAAGVRAAYAAFLPGVSVSAGASRPLPATDPTWSSSVGLGANVELFGGGRRIFELQQAHARKTAAGVNEVSQRYGATLAVKEQFFNVLAARESEAAARAQLEQAEQQCRASFARVRARTATQSDSLRSEIQLRNARLAVMDARNALEVADASLTRAAGVPYPVTAGVTDSLERPGLALDDATLRNLSEDAPIVRQAKVDLDAARAARRISWTSYLPSLSAGYSRSGSGTGFWPGDDALSSPGTLRLSLSLPLFDQLQREQQVTQAQVAAENAEAALRDARLAAMEDFTRSLGAFRSAEERVASQTATLQAAEEDLRVQRQRYAVGGSTLLDVLTSQTQLDQGRRDLIRARYDQRVAKAQLEALIGRDL